jgi:uncharacterized lipoprotein YmbA
MAWRSERNASTQYEKNEAGRCLRIGPVRLPDIEPLDGLTLEQYALLSFMRHWSEQLWAASWYEDLEVELTSVMRRRSAREEAPPTQFETAYQSLVEMAGGWFTWDSPHKRFVTGSYDELLARSRHPRR